MFLLTLVLLSGVIALLYVYFIWNFNYWKNRNIPGPTPKPLLGTVPSAITQERNVYYDLADSYK